MKICFFGVGGVGGYFGALVTKRFKNQHEIYFVARGKHKDEINSSGLTLKKSGGDEIINVKPDKCVEQANELPICDIIVLSVKEYDLENATKEILKISNNKTIILPLLNGVDIYERIRKNLNTGIVLPSCVYVGTHIESPGVIYQKGGNCKILFGNDPENSDIDLHSIKSVLSESMIEFSQEENINVSIWSKFMFVAAYGLVTATFKKTVGEILIDDELKNKIKSIMEEIKTISEKLNISLPHDIVEKSLIKAKDFPFVAKTSFQRDVERKGKVNEGDLFGGTIIRLGDKLNVPVPATKEVYSRFINNLNGQN
jgi:2-dehydropantoate 2-reductase